MRHTALLVVPTDAHLELALRDGAERGEALAAQTATGVLRDALAAFAPALRLANVHAPVLAAREAVRHRGGPDGGRGGDEPTTVMLFAHALDEALGTLRRSSATARDVRGAVDRLKTRGAGATHATGAFVADAWEDVDARLERATLLDARGAGSALAARVTSVDAASLRDALGAGEGELRFQGKIAWTADDLAWLEALHRTARRDGFGVTVELPRIAGGDGEGFDVLADELERRWASLDDAPEIDWTAPPFALEDVGRMHIVEAKSREAEARAAVAAVLDALGTGAPPEGIAITVPALDDARLDPLRAALAEARVPYVEPRGRSPSAAPEGQAALALLALAEGPILRDELVDLLRAPGVHPGSWVERAGERTARHRASLLAQRLRDVPVRADRAGQVLLEVFATAQGARASGVPEGARDAWMVPALGRILASLSWVGTARSLCELVRRFDALLESTRLGNPSAGELGAALRDEEAAARSEADPFGALRALGEGAAAIRALRATAAALAEAAAALGCADAPMSPAELALALERTVSSEHRPSLRAGAVRIARPAELCGLPLDVAIVVGLDGAAYADSGAPHPLLDDRLVAALPFAARPPGRAQRHARARAELAWTIAGAKRIVLCWTSARDGEETAPDAWIRRAANGAAPQRVEPAARVAATAAVLSARGDEIAAIAAGAPPPPDIAAVVAIERARTAFFFDPKAPGARHTGAIATRDAQGRAHLVACFGGDGPDRPIAVTHVERAVGCAFAGFARRVLHVRRIDDAAEGGDPRERGTLVHRALRAAFEAAQTAPPDAPDRALALARDAAERAVALDHARTPLRREILERAVDDSVRAVARALASDEPVRFFLAERRFGAGEPAPWCALALAPDDGDGPAVYIEGQIDRIDRSTDGRSLRVIDYKTGKPPELAEIGSTALQLPLYAALAVHALGAVEARGAYVRVTSRGVIETFPADWDKQRATVATHADIAREARARVLALWDGRIAPRPVRATLCATCDARDVCRRPAVAPIEEAP